MLRDANGECLSPSSEDGDEPLEARLVTRLFVLPLISIAASLDPRLEIQECDCIRSVCVEAESCARLLRFNHDQLVHERRLVMARGKLELVIDTSHNHRIETAAKVGNGFLD